MEQSLASGLGTGVNRVVRNVAEYGDVRINSGLSRLTLRSWWCV